MINRSALHEVLDAAIDTMLRLGESAYIGFDLSSYTVNLRVSIPRNASGWKLYEHYNVNEINEETVKEILGKLEDLETKPDINFTNWMTGDNE